MKTIIHPSHSRGYADHGWLKSYHSFSFADYYNPNKMNFGALRVLNDDTIAGGMGFGAHPHTDMEIITIPLIGKLEHKDNIGNQAVSEPGYIQVMSAGQGIVHSEYNAQTDAPVELLQLWINTDQAGVRPRYEQKYFEPKERINQFQQIIRPIYSQEEGLGIYQQAWIQRLSLTARHTLEYKFKREQNGVYIFVLSGSLKIGGTQLNDRDAIGISGSHSINLSAVSDCDIILFEIPINSGI